MSPKCEVSTLGELALYAVVVQVTQALSDDEGTFHDVVSEYHRYTPPEVLEDMLRDILSNEFLDAGTRFSCLQVLLRDNVRRLETGMFPTSYFEPIVQVIRLQGSGLHHLSLKGVWLKDNPRLLCEMIAGLQLLRVLHVPHLVDDEVLLSITKCPTLTILDISGECSFKPETITQFCNILRQTKSFLQVVDIGSYGEENKPHESIAELIETFPNLISLSSYSFVGKSLWSIYKRRPDFRCKLKYIHDTNTTKETCDSLLELCPELEDLYFDTPEEKVIQRIRKCDTLHTLRFTRFQCSELHDLLANWPNRLNTLKLNLGRGVLDVSRLASGCPELISLEMFKMEMLVHSTEQPFPRLEALEITYSDTSPTCLRYLLGTALHLQRVAVGEPVKLTDGDLYRLCADYCLVELQELWFASARYLTVNAVELLMGHCPELRLLGQLSGWNVNSEDFDILHAVIQSTNTDLTLLPPGILP